MRILKIDAEENFLHVVPQTIDDLWHLERIIEPNDVLSGASTRKIKVSENEGAESKREKFFLEIAVQKVEFHKYSKQLRASGIVKYAKPEDVAPLGSSHTLEIILNEPIKIKKLKLKQYQIQRLKKAEQATRIPELLLIVMDDEQADFALVKQFGLEHKLKMHAGKSGKRYATEDAQKKYFSEMLKKISEIKADKIIIAGPGFAKEDFEKYLEEKSAKFEIVWGSTNSVGETGFNEAVKSGLIESVLKETAVAEEIKNVSKLYEELAKNSGLVAYGEKEVQNAINYGAVKKILITDEKLFAEREKMETLMESAEKTNAEVHIISAEGDAGKQLSGLTGIAALLRFRVE